MAAKLAEIYGGEGSAAALSHIAARSSRETAVAAEKTLDSLFSSLKVSIVRLIIEGRPSASGFFVAPGRVLTTAHALRGEEVRATLQLHTGEELDATVLAWDYDADLALLATDRQDFPALTFQESAGYPDIVAIFREEITAIGYTGSSPEPQVRVGPVTGIEMHLAGFSGAPMIETRLHTAYGFSGAPGVNPKGHVIGIVRAARKEGGYSYLIPSDSVLNFLHQHEVAASLAD
ncbi:serine protease [Streptomyces sp. NPDC007901]|uniref:S1 family peptidase n=1 Tax=Streptomyces sp. NPDC007901 TaxID=3364785 RepID=UPI0036F017F7